MMLAQINSSASEIAAWLMGFFAIAGGVNQAWKFIDRIKGKPAKPPNEVLDNMSKAVSQRLDRAEIRVEELSGRLSAQFADEDRKHSIHRKTLYEEIKQVRLEMKGDLDKQTARLEERIESMPEKLINLLRNTGAIGGHK